MQKNIKTKKGFTLLIAIIVTAMLLIISFVVANIAYKQLVLANSNQESQYAFYNADSGIECALYWDFKNGYTVFNPSVATTSMRCNGQAYNTGGTGNATTTFTLNLTKGCAIVSVGKHANGLTIVDSRGYNTCSGGTARRLERAEKLTYTN